MEPNPKLTTTVHDPVNHPSHYKGRDANIECLDAIRAATSHVEFVGFLRATIMKYLWRGPHKESELQDYRKAAFYLDRLIKEVASVGNNIGGQK